MSILALDEVINMARDTRRCEEYVIARGAIVEFLLQDSKIKFIPKEVYRYLEISKQTLSHALKIIPKYRQHNCYIHCLESLRHNEEVFVEQVNQYLDSKKPL